MILSLSLFLCYMMATTASSAANSASRFSIDSSISRSRHGDSSPWLLPSDSHDHPTLSLSQDDPFSAPSVSPPTGNNSSDYDNADKKPPPVWNMPSSNSSSDVGPVMGAAESWPALSLSARSSSIKSPSLDASKPFPDGSSSSIPPPQVVSFCSPIMSLQNIRDSPVSTYYRLVVSSFISQAPSFACFESKEDNLV